MDLSQSTHHKSTRLFVPQNSSPLREIIRCYEVLEGNKCTQGAFQLHKVFNQSLASPLSKSK